MSRLFGDAIPIEVRLLDGISPKEIRWEHGKHQVKKIANHWRVDFGWQPRIWRDYFRIETKGGLMLTIYHDLVADQWYWQTSYD